MSAPPRLLAGLPEFERIALQEDPVSTKGKNEGAVQLALEVRPASLRERVGTLILIETFKLQFAGAIEDLKSQQIFDGLGLGSSEVRLMTSGNSLAAQDAVVWLLEKLLSFAPTANEVKLAEAGIESSQFEALSNSWPAMMASGALDVVKEKGRYLPEAVLKTLKKPFTAEEILRIRKRLMSRANRSLILSGAFTEASARDLNERIRTLSPQALTAKGRQARDARFFPVNQSLRFWRRLPASQNPQTFAHAMLTEGPAVLDAQGGLSPDYIAFELMSEAISTAVFQLNRGEKGLGYVHRATSQAFLGRSQLVMLGQTDGSKERFEQIREGWNTILQQIVEGTFSIQKIEAARAGYILKEGMLPETHSDSAEDLRAGLAYAGDPGLMFKIRAAVEAMSAEEALSRMSKIIKASRAWPEAVMSKKPVCAGMLASIAAARRHMASKLD